MDSIYDAQPLRRVHRKRKQYKGGQLAGKAELLENTGEPIDASIEPGGASSAYSAVPSYGAGALMRPGGAAETSRAVAPAGVVNRIKSMLGLNYGENTAETARSSSMRPRTGRSEAAVTAVPGMSQRSISR